MANEQAPADKPPTAAEFEQAFERAAKENPEILGSLTVTALLACLRRTEEHEDKINKLAVASLAIAKKQGLVSAAPHAPASAAPANGVPPGSGAERKGADGRILTPEEARVEDMMDTAEVDNSQPAPVLAGQGPAQKPRIGRPGVQPAASNGGGQRVGADGKPLTPQEAEIEQMMDEAPVVND